MKNFILILLTLISFNVQANTSTLSSNMTCLERLSLRKGYNRAILPLRIVTLGVIGSINKSRIRGTRRTYKILVEARRCALGCVNYSSTFRRFRRRVEKKLGYLLDNEQLADFLNEASQRKFICPKTETGARRHFKYRELKKYTVQNI